jgi:hypothetical protein
LLGCLALLSVSGCSEYGYTEATQLDVFRQNRRNAVDLMVVIDNSCSMVEEQQNLARNFDALIDTFAGADVDWQIAVTTTDAESERYRGLFIGGDDEVVVRGASGEIDRVQYDREWAFVPGTSMQLDTGKYAWVSNDSPTNWCPSTADFGGGALGSPGEWNVGCEGSGEGPPTPETDDGPLLPSSGDLIITELMAWSGGDDARCEWFELTNLTDDTLDLDGIELSDQGNNLATFPDGLTLAPYDALVVGRADTDNCNTPVDVVVENFSLNHDVRVFDSETSDGASLFGENIAQGTIGTGIEMGLEASRLVFEEPFWTDHNDIGFLRDDAILAILYVSDEDDVSPYPVDAYLRYFHDLKGEQSYRYPETINLSAVVGKEPTARFDIPSCESPAGQAFYGRRYLEAAAETGGLVESICEEDFAPIVTDLGLTLSGLEARFELSELPDLSTLEVKLYADENDDSFVRDLVRDTDFEYVIEGNYLYFSEGQVPPSEYSVTVRYQVLPTGATLTEEGGVE